MELFIVGAIVGFMFSGAAFSNMLRDDIHIADYASKWFVIGVAEFSLALWFLVKWAGW